MAEEHTDPTNCSTCKTSLAESGWVSYYKDNELISSVCIGCDLVEKFMEWHKSGHITTPLHLHAILSKDQIYNRIRMSGERIREEIDRFSRWVWAGGLGHLVRESNERGHRADLAADTMLVWSCAGRTAITLETTGASITLLAATDEPQGRMGLQGISATESQALRLLSVFSEAWVRREVVPKPDRNVGMF